jgi:hypothetical protein
MNDPSAAVVLMTNRVIKLNGAIMAVLKKNGLTFDHYSFKAGNQTKGERAMDIVRKHYPDAKKVELIDDDPTHFQHFHDAFVDSPYDYHVIRAMSGHLMD